VFVILLLNMFIYIRQNYVFAIKVISLNVTYIAFFTGLHLNRFFMSIMWRLNNQHCTIVTKDRMIQYYKKTDCEARLTVVEKTDSHYHIKLSGCIFFEHLYCI